MLWVQEKETDDEIIGLFLFHIGIRPADPAGIAYAID